MKNKRKILTALLFLTIFVYLLISIIGVIKDIRQKKIQEQELMIKIQQQEELYNELLEEQKLIEEMDPEYLEELARELGMLKEGEILFEERKD